MTSFLLVVFFTATVHLLLKTSPPKISLVSALLSSSSPSWLSIPLKYSSHHHRSNSLVCRYEYSHSRYTTNTRRSTRCQMTIDDEDDEDIGSSSSSNSNNDNDYKTTIIIILLKMKHLNKERIVWKWFVRFKNHFIKMKNQFEYQHQHQ